MIWYWNCLSLARISTAACIESNWCLAGVGGDVCPFSEAGLSKFCELRGALAMWTLQGCSVIGKTAERIHICSLKGSCWDYWIDHTKSVYTCTVCVFLYVYVADHMVYLPLSHGFAFARWVWRTSSFFATLFRLMSQMNKVVCSRFHPQTHWCRRTEMKIDSTWWELDP